MIPEQLSDSVTRDDATAAMGHIDRGDWDRFLIRIQAVINTRMRSTEWVHHISVGK